MLEMLHELRKVLLDMRQCARQLSDQRAELFEMIGERAPALDPVVDDILERTAECLRIIDAQIVAETQAQIDIANLSDEDIAVLERVITQYRLRTTVTPASQP